MCTAVYKNGGRKLFGRSLDVEVSYGESVIITPRARELSFSENDALMRHCAMIGIGCAEEGYPLYFDAVNEYGVAMAGLNLTDSAVYHPSMNDKYNVASYELIPWVLSQCRNADDVIALLEKTNVTKRSFSENIRATPLHWMICCGERCFAVESLAEGLKIYEDPFGVLTNEPPFPYQMKNLVGYMGLTPKQPPNKLCDADIKPYTLGVGSMGLPGDHSSCSRFVRALFTKENTLLGEEESEAVNGFFHIMDTVKVPFGCVEGREGKPHFTRYVSCADTESLVYYFVTYRCRRIRSIALKESLLELPFIITYPLDDIE
ncbi:MAG: choloylglycine hydrolase family protein [Ruminococcaceae bacterium]|nr:choloylglycine hydrolase family protein [Oscillospiraceae bacterium]